jgi:hypothetical protein
MLLWMVLISLVTGLSLGTLGVLVLRDVLATDDEDDKDPSPSSYPNSQ